MRCIFSHLTLLFLALSLMTLVPFGADGQDRRTQQALDAAQAEIATITEGVRQAETQLSELEHNITALSQTLAELRQRLDAQERTARQSVSALLAMGRKKLGSTLLEGRDPIDQVHGRLLLRSARPILLERIQEMNALYSQESALRLELDREQAALRRQRREFDLRRTQLIDALNIFAEQQGDTPEGKAAQALSQQADDIESLVNALLKADSLAAATPDDDFTIYPPLSGYAIAPILEEEEEDAPPTEGEPFAKSLMLVSRPAGLVVAPAPGRIRFAETFRGYGHVVILDHLNGYHSVIMGLARTNVVEGETVSKGYPIGFLALTALEATFRDDNGKPALYFELRQGSRLIDPLPFFRPALSFRQTESVPDSDEEG